MCSCQLVTLWSFGGLSFSVVVHFDIFLLQGPSKGLVPPSSSERHQSHRGGSCCCRSGNLRRLLRRLICLCLPTCGVITNSNHHYYHYHRNQTKKGNWTDTSLRRHFSDLQVQVNICSSLNIYDEHLLVFCNFSLSSLFQYCNHHHHCHHHHPHHPHHPHQHHISR